MDKLCSVVILAFCLPLSVFSQEPTKFDACGGASILALEGQQPQEDPVTQAKMDRLAIILRANHKQCMNRLDQIHRKDEALGIASSVHPASAMMPLYSAAPALVTTCSVIASSGQPCIKKLSEKRGVNGAQDEVVYGNGCATAMEVSVFFNDGSRSSSTVKSKSISTLTCDNCGGLRSFEASCL